MELDSSSGSPQLTTGTTTASHHHFLQLLVYRWWSQTGCDITEQVNHIHVIAWSPLCHQKLRFYLLHPRISWGHLIDSTGNVNEHDLFLSSLKRLFYFSDLCFLPRDVIRVQQTGSTEGDIGLNKVKHNERFWASFICVVRSGGGRRNWCLTLVEMEKFLLPHIQHMILL